MNEVLRTLGVQKQPRGLRIALLAGGSSNERDVSLAAVDAVKSALEESFTSVEHIDPAVPTQLATLSKDNYDLAFIMMHGKGGEDGAIQGYLETIGLPYTGSGILASATAISKSAAKIVYEAHGIKTPKAMKFASDQVPDVMEVLATVGLPCVVKPDSEGSSVGIAKADTEEELSVAIQEISKIAAAVLVEQYVEGREFTASVIGRDNVVPFPLIEIKFEQDINSFAVKHEGLSTHVCPAELDDELTQACQGVAVQAHKVLGCNGASRSDFRLDESGELWLLETNTIPGMAERSALPRAAREAGLALGELCATIAALAVTG